MNREHRRRARQQARNVRAFAAEYECPDCIAETALVKEQPGVWTLRIAHDNTCPYYRAMTERTTR